MKKAFTMLEMVFVIVITGLVAVAGSMAIIQIMQNYAIQREYAKMELDSTSAILQISKYLQNSIFDSIAIKSGNIYTPISKITSQLNGKVENNKSLIFISKNSEVLNGSFISNQGVNSNLPLFSGFVDTTKSSNVNITTGFSIDQLTKLKSFKNLALYFPSLNTTSNPYNDYYSNNPGALFNISSITSNTAMTLAQKPNMISDIAIIVNNKPINMQKDGNGNLKIIDPNLGSIPLTIAQGISNLYIWQEAPGLIRMKLCFTNKTMDFIPEFCKEGAVMQ